MFVLNIVNLSFLIINVYISLTYTVQNLTKWIYLESNYYFILSLSISELIFSFTRQLFQYYIQFLMFFYVYETGQFINILYYIFLFSLFQLYFFGFSIQLFNSYTYKSMFELQKFVNVYNVINSIMIVGIILQYVFSQSIEKILFIISVYLFIIQFEIKFSKKLTSIIFIYQIFYLIVQLMFVFHFEPIKVKLNIPSLVHLLLYFSDEIQYLILSENIIFFVFQYIQIRHLDTDNLNKIVIEFQNSKIPYVNQNRSKSQISGSDNNVLYQ